MALWGGRFEKSIDEGMHDFNRSLSFDHRLAAEDVEGSIAWARALARADVLDPMQVQAIVAGLEAIMDEIEHDRFHTSPEDEDIHSAVERRLGEIAGDVAGMLHTGRSRNDQVATDFRLWVMRACTVLEAALANLQRALVTSAERGLDVPMPGQTHMQPAQPVTWGHWALSHVWPIARDRTRFAAARASAAVMPLGSGALAGTGFAIDRVALAADLGFDRPCENSMDGVSDRDFALDFAYAAAVVGVHVSRLAEQVILFGNPAFGFVEFDDAFSTGSSLMPQKKNPDPLELARGKSGRLIASLMGLLVTLKGLPSAYDKDLQEDKEPVFDAFDTLRAALPVISGCLESMRIRPERMAAALDPAMWATDLADYLVRRGVAFRTAHHVAGRAVRAAETKGVALDGLELEELRQLCDVFEADVAAVFDWSASLASRGALGGTSPTALAVQLDAARWAIGEGEGGSAAKKSVPDCSA